MEIIEIYPPFLYSIKYDEMDDNEYDRLFSQWNDVNYVISFMNEHKTLLSNDVWVDVREPEDAAKQVLEEAEDLEELIDELCKNTDLGETPDLESHFRYLEGKYNYVVEYKPVKSYGVNKPSLLRMYAIRLESNCYVVTGGGIKLSDTIQNSPDLKDHVFKNIDSVRAWLKENGIVDANDI